MRSWSSLVVLVLGASACVAGSDAVVSEQPVVTPSAPYRLRVELPPGVAPESLAKPLAFIAADGDRSNAASYTTLVPGQTVALAAARGCLRMPAVGPHALGDDPLNCSIELDASREVVVRMSLLRDGLLAGKTVAFVPWLRLVRIEDSGAEYPSEAFTYDPTARFGSQLLVPGKYRVKVYGSMGITMEVPEGAGDFRPALDIGSIRGVTTVRAQRKGAAAIFPDAPGAPSATKVVTSYAIDRYTEEAPLRADAPLFVLPSALPSLFRTNIEAFGEPIDGAYATDDVREIVVDLQRLDVADVTLATSTVPGRYTVSRLAEDGQTWLPLLAANGAVAEMPTSTGLDVPRGTYKITVRFDGGGASPSIVEERRTLD